MAHDNTTLSSRLEQWFEDMEQFTLPNWEQLPQLELYMDQVILLLRQYLSPLQHSGEDKTITTSIINNYVRMKIIPPPVKKKYSRVHMASLIMICILKQSLSISCIQRMLPEEQNEDTLPPLYRNFVEQYQSVQKNFIQHARNSGHSSLMRDTAALLTSCAVVSTLSTELTEFLLHDENSRNK